MDFISFLQFFGKAVSYRIRYGPFASLFYAIYQDIMIMLKIVKSITIIIKKLNTSFFLTLFFSIPSLPHSLYRNINSLIVSAITTAESMRYTI